MGHHPFSLISSEDITHQNSTTHFWWLLDGNTSNLGSTMFQMFQDLLSVTELTMRLLWAGIKLRRFWSFSGSLFCFGLLSIEAKEDRSKRRLQQGKLRGRRQGNWCLTVPCKDSCMGIMIDGWLLKMHMFGSKCKKMPGVFHSSLSLLSY